MNTTLTDDQLQEIFSLKHQKPFTRYSVIADKYNINVDVLKELMGEYQERKMRDGIFQQLRAPQPLQSRENTLPKPLQIYGPTLVIGDVHGCFLNVSYFKEMLYRAKEEGITQIVINGDFFDASVTKPQLSDLYSPSVIEELSFARDILYEIQRYGFTTIYMTKGNHDQWMCDEVNLSFQDLMNQLSPIPCIVTEYPFLFLDDILIGHLDKYSYVPGELALGIVDKTGRDVLVNHDHIVGAKMHDEYQAWGVSVGCMVDPQAVWYKVSSFNNLPDWNNGAVIVSEQYIDCYHGIWLYMRIVR